MEIGKILASNNTTHHSLPIYFWRWRNVFLYKLKFSRKAPKLERLQRDTQLSFFLNSKQYDQYTNYFGCEYTNSEIYLNAKSQRCYELWCQWPNEKIKWSYKSDDSLRFSYREDTIEMHSRFWSRNSGDVDIGGHIQHQMVLRWALWTFLSVLYNCYSVV